MRLPFLVVACAVVLRCGSSLDQPITNEEACRRVRVALEKVCTAGEVKWLNCGELPGCTSGSVSGKDIDSCVAAIEGSTSCAKAEDLECKVSKLDCATSSSALETACGNLSAALTIRGCTTTFACGDFVKCDASKVSLPNLDTCFRAVLGTTSCSAATDAAKACNPPICNAE